MELEPKEPMSLTKKERKRIQSLNKKGISKRQIADDLKINRKTVDKWCSRNDQDNLKRKRKPKFNKEMREYTILLMQLRDSVTPTILHKLIEDKFKTKISFSVVVRWLNLIKDEQKDQIKKEDHILTNNEIEIKENKVSSNLQIEIEIENDLPLKESKEPICSEKVNMLFEILKESNLCEDKTIQDFSDLFSSESVLNLELTRMEAFKPENIEDYDYSPSDYLCKLNSMVYIYLIFIGK